MTIQNKKLNNLDPDNSNQDRLQEVAKILALGIIRLDQKEKGYNPHFPLDHKNFPSTHSNGINPTNQMSRIYE